MTNLDIAQPEVLYKSPKSIHKGLSLRDLFPGTNEPKSTKSPDPEDPIRMAVSVRPGVWKKLGESFESFEKALALVHDFEQRGYRVKILNYAG